MNKRGPVVSFDFIGEDNAEVSFKLDSEYGISTRCGMHCAPNAHKTLETYPQGTVRFAFGFKIPWKMWTMRFRLSRKFSKNRVVFR